MNKFLTLILLTSFVLLTGCVTTNVYPGQREGRTYESQNTRVCETLEIECGDNEVLFNDYTGCGCETVETVIPNDPIPNDQLPIDEPVEPVPDDSGEPEPPAGGYGDQ